MTKKYKIADTISWQIEKSEDFVYILNHTNNQYYELKDVGKEIWLLICQQLDKEEILETLLKKYRVDANILNKDVQELIDILRVERIVESV